MRSPSIVLVLASLPVAARAQAPLLEGHTLGVIEWVSTSPSPPQTTFGPVTAVVGPGIEITQFGWGSFLQVDFSDRAIQLTATSNQPSNYGDLLSLYDADGTVPDLVLVEVSSTFPAVTGDDVHVFRDNVLLQLFPGNAPAGATITVNLNPFPSPSSISCVPGEAGVPDCPCGRPDVVPAPSHAPFGGCANPVNPGGARLEGYGRAVTIDMFETLVLYVQGLPNALTIFIEGDATLATPQPFGDGILCVGGNVLRFGEQIAVEGRARYPRTGDPRISDVTFPQSGSTRHYQALYRGARPGWCGPATFNVSNGFTVVWH